MPADPLNSLLDNTAKRRAQVLAEEDIIWNGTTDSAGKRVVLPLDRTIQAFEAQRLKITVITSVGTAFTDFEFEILDTDDLTATLQGDNLVADGSGLTVPNQPITAPAKERIIDTDIKRQVRIVGTKKNELGIFINVAGGDGTTIVTFRVQLYGEAMG